MSRLDRLILSDIVAPFFGSLMLFTALFLGADDLLKILDFAKNGVPAFVLIQFFLTALPPVLALTSPMSMLLATLLGFGRLSSNSELTALFAAGTPIGRILAPVAAFAFVVSFVGVWFNDTVIPLAARQRQAIINEQKRALGGTVGAQIFNYRQQDDKGHITALIHVEGPLSFTKEGHYRLEEVTVTHYKDGIPREVIYSPLAEGTEDNSNWQLRSFIAFGKDEKGQTISTKGGDGEVRQATLATPAVLKTSSHPDEELTTPELRNKVQALYASKNLSAAREAEVEIARRYAVPFGSLIFALVGAPLGISPRRSGTEVGFGYSVLITFLYWIALQVASSMGRFGVLPPLLAVMTPDIIGLIVAGYLISRVQR